MGLKPRAAASSSKPLTVRMRLRMLVDEVLAVRLKAAGFRRANLVFRRTRGAVTQVIEFSARTSVSGGKTPPKGGFRVLVGCGLTNSFPSARAPREHDCHLRCEMAALVANARRFLDVPMTRGIHRKRIGEALERDIGTLLEVLEERTEKSDLAKAAKKFGRKPSGGHPDVSWHPPRPPAAVPTADSVPSALRLLLHHVGSKLGELPISGVAETGRTLSVRVDGGPETNADRLALLTLVRDLWGSALTEKGRLPRYIVQGAEFEQYVDVIAAEEMGAARALYAHVEGAAELPLAKGHRLHALFPDPLFATNALNEAASAGALVRRALPHARDGDLVDRLAAIHAIDDATWSCCYHADAEPILAEVGQLAGELSQATSVLLQEASWLLAAKQQAALRSMRA